jgi:Cation efflux family
MVTSELSCRLILLSLPTHCRPVVWSIRRVCYRQLWDLHLLPLRAHLAHAYYSSPCICSAKSSLVIPCSFNLSSANLINSQLHFPTTPVLPLSSLAALPLLSYTLLFLSPNTSRSHNNVSYSPRSFMVSYPSAFVFACIIGIVAFGLYPSFTDIAVGGLLFYGMYPVSLSSLTVPTRTPTARLIRSYIKTILSNPESRKIFYFLMLNLSYMGVQMLYGVWTNSLGLISDAIHMAFDCMAIGMGLFASVMATWEPNERFTYGYVLLFTISYHGIS